MDLKLFNTPQEIIAGKYPVKNFWIISVDIGFSSVKGVAPNKRFCFPSYVKKMDSSLMSVDNDDIYYRASPLVVGLSYFGHGANMDIVRYAKRTMGIFFQIVVILVISVMTTFTHNALITSDSGSTQGETVVANPANGLEVDGSYTEVGVTKTTIDTKKNDASGDEETTVTIGDTTWKPATSEDISTITTRAYTKKSLMNFVYYIMAPNHYVVSTGLMLAALLMVFKSRELSTRLFS